MDNGSSSKHQNHNVPKLRFPGFEGEWSVDYLKEYMIELTELTNQESGYPLMTSSRQGLFVQNEYFNREKQSSEDTLFSVVPRGYVTYRHMSDDDIFHFNINNLADYGLVSREYPVFTTTPNLNSYLLVEILNSSFDFRKFCKQQKKGGTRTRLYFSVLGDYKITIPSIQEQQRIVAFLSLLDERISKQRELVEKLKTYKRGALSVMFPQKGETVPRCRFASFTGDWKLHKFSDFTWDSGKRNKDNLDLEPYAITNEYGFIRQSEAHDDFGYMKDTDRKAYNIVKPNSFAYNPARINVGSIGYYDGTEDVIVSSLYEVFQTADYVDDRFLWHWFKSEEFPKCIEKLQEGSVRLYFYYDKLCECQLLMPSLPEQKKIATILDEFDNYITLHQNKLDVLLKTKQSLLQQLFI